MMQYVEFLVLHGAAEGIVTACVNKGRIDLIKPFSFLLDVVRGKAESMLSHLTNLESEVVDFLLTIVDASCFVPSLSLMMKADAMDSVFKVLHGYLVGDSAVVRERLHILNTKDRDGMSVIDYAYLTHHGTVLAYLGEVAAAANSTDIIMPSVARVELILEAKTETEISRGMTTISGHNQFCLEFSSSDAKDWLKFANEEQKTSCESMMKKMKDWSSDHKEETFKLIDSDIFDWKVIKDFDELLSWKETIEKEKYTILAFDAEFAKADSVSGQALDLDKDQKSVVVSLQVCTGHRAYFIDYLVMNNKPQANCLLREVFENETILKIFHGGHADIVNIYRTFDSLVTNVFDTAKCHSVITKDHAQTRSLASLSKIYLGIGLDKTFQRSNWKIRPLPRGMLDYALADSAILLGVFLAMTQDLEAEHLAETGRRCNQPLQLEDDNKVDMAGEKVELTKSNLRKFKFLFVDN